MVFHAKLHARNVITMAILDHSQVAYRNKSVVLLSHLIVTCSFQFPSRSFAPAFLVQ